MKRELVVAACLLLSSVDTAEARPKTLYWSPGWDEYTEPLNYDKSNIKWSVDQASKKLQVTFTLVGAVPNKLYQVGFHIFGQCPATFGQFLNIGCSTVTAGGVTKSMACIEFGVV